MKGAGDLVARITKLTGIDRAIKAVVGEDCGCDERQELLNNLIPFNGEREHFHHSLAWSITFIEEMKYRAATSKTINNEEFVLIWDVYREYINPRKKNTKCKSCIREALAEMSRVLEAKRKLVEKENPPPKPKAKAKPKAERYNKDEKKPATPRKKRTTKKKTQTRKAK